MEFNWQSYLDSFHFDKEKEIRSQRQPSRVKCGMSVTKDFLKKENIVRNSRHWLRSMQRISRMLSGILRDVSRRWTMQRPGQKYLKEQGYNLYILSNYSRYMLDGTKQNEMPFLKYMDGVIFSCDVNQMKPDIEIYQTLLSKFNLKAEETLFIDDRAENCQGAEKAGIHTIQFKDLKQAAKEMEETYGIK